MLYLTVVPLSSINNYVQEMQTGAVSDIQECCAFECVGQGNIVAYRR